MAFVIFYVIFSLDDGAGIKVDIIIQNWKEILPV